VPTDARSRDRAAFGRSGALLLASLTALLGAYSMLARASSSATGVPSTPVVATLSNLRTISRWAYPQARASVHERPSSQSHVIDRLRFLTGDGQAQVYQALRSYTLGPATWILVPIPGRPNGAAGWVQADALGELHITRERLRVNRETLRATLYENGRVIWRAPVGVGRPSLPTPAGRFYVTEKLTALGGPRYGPYAIGTSAYAPSLTDWPGGGVVGIHGTDEPKLIPGRPSHGCIRLRDRDVTRLWRVLAVGTPIEIV
jgi:hypothetical protein